MWTLFNFVLEKEHARGYTKEEQGYGYGICGFEKNFDNVNWHKLFEILEELVLKFRDIKITYILYKDQVHLISAGKEKNQTSIKKGIKECSLSPLLFNI